MGIFIITACFMGGYICAYLLYSYKSQRPSGLKESLLRQRSDPENLQNQQDSNESSFMSRSLNLIKKKFPRKVVKEVDTYLPNFLRFTGSVYGTPIPKHTLDDEETLGYYVHCDNGNNTESCYYTPGTYDDEMTTMQNDEFQGTNRDQHFDSLDPTQSIV